MNSVIVAEPVERQPPSTEVEAKLCALRRLLEDDPDEQRETYQYLKHAVNAPRLPYRLVFTDDDDCAT